MQEEVIKKAKVLLGAGIDEDAIISSLGISINDLEKIKTGEAEKPRKAPLPQNTKNKFMGKITEEVFADLKKRIENKADAVPVRVFCVANDISFPTYYRIKKSASYEDYKTVSSDGYTGDKGAKRERKPNPYNESNRVVKNEEEFLKLKEELANRSVSVRDFAKQHGFSSAIYYRLNSADSFEEYQNASTKLAASRRVYKKAWRAKKRAERNGQLTLEDAVKIIEPYAIPKEEPKKVPTQVEVLERIATQLERLADYEQMKLSKKRWFRRASK